MGRYSWSDRKTIEECRSIDVFWFSRQDWFCGFIGEIIQWKNNFGEITSSIGINVSTDEEKPEDNFVRLYYTQTNSSTKKKTELDYRVELATTPCNSGGRRYWFVCPLRIDEKPCQRRVAKLYLPSERQYFGCRHCYNLTYESCRESHKRDRLYRIIGGDIPGGLSKSVKRTLGLL